MRSQPYFYRGRRLSPSEPEFVPTLKAVLFMVALIVLAVVVACCRHDEPRDGQRTEARP